MTKSMKLNKPQDRLQPVYGSAPGSIIEYPAFRELAEKQSHSHWPGETEFPVQDDLNDLLNSSDETIASITELTRLFTHYEIRAGDDFWIRRVSNVFPRHELQRMSTSFANAEANSHAPFYDQINKLLHLDTPEFYDSWKLNPDLVNRMAYISKVLSAEDDLIALAGFSFIEGAVLYTSFAYLRHFQVEEYGLNLIPNIGAGINSTVAEENLHATGAALLFRTILKERGLGKEDRDTIRNVIFDLAREVLEHETHIIDLVRNEHDPVSKENLVSFAKHRINLCLNYLGYANLYTDEEMDGVVEKWFYRDTNALTSSDFFAVAVTEYSINWTRSKFGDVWRTKKTDSGTVA